MNKEMKFCQSCGMPLTEEVLGTNADGSKNEDYCMYCYKDGKFLQDCTMDEMIEHFAQFVGAVNEGLEKPITKEEYIGMMKTYFPQLKRWRQTLDVSNDEVVNVNPALAGVKEDCKLNLGSFCSLDDVMLLRGSDDGHCTLGNSPGNTDL